MYQQIDKKIIQAYNNVFTGGDGPIVLEHMLIELGFWDYSVPGDELTHDERVLQDYAKRILVLMGVWDKKNIKHVVNDFVKLPLRLPVKEEKENNAEGV